MLKTTANPCDTAYCVDSALLYQAPAALPRDTVGLAVDALAS
jgi:hypothetical protein